VSTTDEPDRDEPLRPTRPDEENVREQDPPPMQVEPARLLANDARDRLTAEGFDDDEIERWATTYIARFGQGSVEDFVAWIAEQQR
jgi:hypothetical protein